MAAVRAVLLDAFGTLLRLEPPAPRLRDALRDRLGVPVTLAAAERGMAAEIAYNRAHHDEGVDPASLADLRRRCAAQLRDHLGEHLLDATLDTLVAALADALRFEPFPEVPAALRALRSAGARLVVVSNWDISLGDALRATGLAELVDGAVSSAQAGSAKPHPGIFERALRLAGTAPPEAVHVGDSLEHDVSGARAAGIAAVLLARDGAPAPPCVPVIRSLDELLSTGSYPVAP
jgi:putative hydrolase of the HAD superfamily